MVRPTEPYFSVAPTTAMERGWKIASSGSRSCGSPVAWSVAGEMAVMEVLDRVSGWDADSREAVWIGLPALASNATGHSAPPVATGPMADGPSGRGGGAVRVSPARAAVPEPVGRTD